MLNALKITRKVVDRAKSVSIDIDNVWTFAESLRDHIPHAKVESWVDNKWTFSDAAFLLLIFNSINFCFWAKPGDKKWTTNSNNSGARGLFLCLEKEAETNNRFFDPQYWFNMTTRELSRILAGNVEIPMLPERVACAKNVGEVLSVRYDGIEDFLSEYHTDAISYVNGLASDFSSYYDCRDYLGVGNVQFLKRAQLFVSLLSDVLVTRGYNGLEGIDQLTAFADYRIPQVLRHYGVLGYEQNLGRAIAGGVIIPEHSREEIEIRACTIWAVEEIKSCLREMGCSVTSAFLDNILWNTSQKIKEYALPCHLTYTTAY